MLKFAAKVCQKFTNVHFLLPKNILKVYNPLFYYEKNNCQKICKRHKSASQNKKNLNLDTISNQIV